MNYTVTATAVMGLCFFSRMDSDIAVNSAAALDYLKRKNPERWTNSKRSIDKSRFEPLIKRFTSKTKSEVQVIGFIDSNTFQGMYRWVLINF